VIRVDGAETQPVKLSVKVKVAVPGAIPVIIPPLEIDAIEGLLLTQTPPEDGNNDVVVPIHIEDGPFKVTGGPPFTFICRFVIDAHPNCDVNIILATPFDIPVTTPAPETVATIGLLLDHDPPVVGESVVVAPTQMIDGPVMATSGRPFTVIGSVAFEIQPEEVSVK